MSDTRGMRRLSLALAIVSLSSAACSGGNGGPGCNDGNGTMPADAEILSWDNGSSKGSVRGKGFYVTDPVNGAHLQIDTEPLWEATRFDLDRPATIYGFSVKWANLGQATNSRVEAGLYPDF